jgi:methyl-accepting chemotaxis protein
MPKIDFDYAKTEHVIWLVRLNRFLGGKRKILASELVSQEQCKLGKWLQGEGVSKYSGFAEIKELVKKHIELHVLVKIIIAMKEAGDDEQAKKKYKELEKISNRIVALINSLKQKIKD